MKLLCFGVSHQSAPFHVLEPLSLDASGMTDLLGRLCERKVVREVVGISTCNRTEFYMEAGGSLHDARTHLVQTLVRHTGADASVLSEHGYMYSGDKAARHLFRVASGVDSLIVGELQILGQLRTALETAQEAGTAGRVMEAFFTRGIQAARRAHRETAIGRGNVSVASVAVSIARRMFTDLSRKRALIVGAGQTSKIAGMALRSSGVGSILVANRTHARAEALAGELDASVCPFDALEFALTDADIVVCATGSQDHLVHADWIRRRKGRVLLLLDLSLPRNIDPKCGKRQDVFLYGLEDLQQVAGENRAQREAEISGVEKVLDAELDKFRRWMARGEAERVIDALRHRTESIRKQHLRQEAETCPPETRERLEVFSASLLRSVLHDLTSNLRRLDPQSDAGRRDLKTARTLFVAGAEDSQDES